MTSLVALRCSDGVVIGADSAVTFGSPHGVSAIEQHTSQKIKIIDGRIIVAGTGQLGLMQRFTAAVTEANRAKALKESGTAISFGKSLSALGLKDFSETHLEKFDYSAFVAFTADGDCHLCELDGESGFQPELKESGEFWHASSGSGQPITDPFLALLREAFWTEGPPNLRGGIFTALWVLKHVCKINAGGIGDPIHIAVLEKSAKGRARMLSPEELAEQENIVEAAMRHLGSFRQILEGALEVEEVPSAPSLKIKQSGSREL